MKTETRWFFQDGTEVDWNLYRRSNKMVWQFRQIGLDLPGHRQNSELWGAYPKSEAGLPEKDRTWSILRVISFKVNGSSHKCDARCLNAKGGNCDCSCGGKNHGLHSH